MSVIEPCEPSDAASGSGTEDSTVEPPTVIVTRAPLTCGPATVTVAVIASRDGAEPSATPAT